MSQAGGEGGVDQAGETATGRMISVANFTLLPSFPSVLGFCPLRNIWWKKKEGGVIIEAAGGVPRC